ncbi:hypothetical protein [Pendulispora albinea]|uniref:Uncharacterized protein n=1 Tax=Pendulispora albinea TaxID=2741071 RepID=A0ABZ2LWT6_9BACT
MTDEETLLDECKKLDVETARLIDDNRRLRILLERHSRARMENLIEAAQHQALKALLKRVT